MLHPDYVHTRPNGVVSDGDTAVLTGRSGIVSDDATGALQGETRWTRIFLRQGGTWKLVTFQATLVPKK